MNLNVIDEKHPGKVAGVYERELSAKQAIKLLRSEGGFPLKKLIWFLPMTLISQRKSNLTTKALVAPCCDHILYSEVLVWFWR